MHKKPITIGTNIFIMTLSVVTGVLLLTSLISMGIFSTLIRDTVETQSREINKQIVMNFESYISSVIETANYIQFASIPIDIGKDPAQLDELYKINTAIKKDMVSIFLFDKTGKYISGPALDFTLSNSVADKPWFLAARRIPEIYTFHADQFPSIAANRDDYVIAVSKSIEFLRNGRTEIGVLLIELNNDVLTDLARRTDLGEGGHLLILDSNGKLLYSSEKGGFLRTEKSAPLAANIMLGSRRVVLHNIDMYINVNSLTQTRWLIATVSNTNAIKNGITRLAIILFIVFCICIAASALVAGFISIRVSRPINQLKKSMLKIEDGDFSLPAAVSGQTEIVSLSHSFTSMVLKIRELMARVVSQQREKRKMELQVLQNQINPHFLYNTLDSIVWLAENNRNEDVVTTVVSLAHFFRISISKGELFIPVRDEISHIQNYLTIQSIRYVNKFNWEISVAPEIMDRRVMKLILQPLVENAIYHGIGEDSGMICIAGSLENDFLIFSVTNSGYGISDAIIQEMYAKMKGGAENPSVGMRNVYQRLKLYYGENAEVIITSERDESTKITLRIPPEIQEEKLS
ncbi:MAG TPA: sensor histidine kinase [Treponemataceae bacterium]|nr:sensor histidine kinase [Treponemataceae bacterium]